MVWEVVFFILLELLVFNTSHLVQLMILQLCRSVKLWSTCLALEFSVFFVTSEVIFEMPFCDKFLVTDLAFIISLSLVAFHVHIEISFFSEVISADVTSEWFNTEMLSEMDFKSWFLWIADATNMTLKRLLITVVYHVSLQMPFCDEGETTMRKLALKWPFIGLIYVSYER